MRIKNTGIRGGGTLVLRDPDEDDDDDFEVKDFG
jgi:hypothetical protein